MVVVHFVSGSRKRKPDLRINRPRTRKRIRDEDARFRNDFISRLSDDVLHQILSFLPTKDLVRTSVLSTRWRDVWNFFPVVDIDFGSKEMHELRIGFRDLMEREMLNPSSVRIRKFCLWLGFTATADASDIMLWVDKVMEHKVQELDLTVRKETINSLPDQFFSSNSLTKLNIEMGCELTIPDSVCFPRLKILRLSGLKFTNVRPTEKLFSSCPVLEELDLIDCNWSRISSSVIYIPSLRTLSIAYFPFEDLPYTKIMISALNLVSFKCVSYEPMDLVLLCNQSSLEDASIDVLNEEFSNPESSLQRTVKLLHGIQAVKSLTLSSYTLKGLSNAILPVFHNLIKMELGVSEFCAGWDFLSNLLSNAPNLKTLVFGEGLLLPDDSETPDGLNSFDWDPLESPPACLQLHLKEIKIHDFVGRQCECFLIRYLLDNGLVLDKMTVYWFDTHQVLTKSESEVMSYERASLGCVVEFLAPL